METNDNSNLIGFVQTHDQVPLVLNQYLKMNTSKNQAPRLTQMLRTFAYNEEFDFDQAYLIRAQIMAKRKNKKSNELGKTGLFQHLFKDWQNSKLILFI